MIEIFKKQDFEVRVIVAVKLHCRWVVKRHPILTMA